MLVWKRIHCVIAFFTVFGGNTHNDTQFSQGAKCYSADFIAYDIACDRWYSLGRRSQIVLLLFINNILCWRWGMGN
jgi:hypothetical protein